jgi:hypothetical protein
MAITAKTFIHNDDKLLGADGSADGILPEDVQDWITANGGTIAKVAHSCTKFGSKVFTVVIIETN